MNKIAIATSLVLGFASVAQGGGDPAIGKDKSAMCGACHGADGNSAVPTFPSLAGQAEGYLIKQLQNFKAGVRKDPVMSDQAKAIEDADIPHLAAYFSSQTRTANTASNPELAAQGRKLFLGGNIATGVSACAACHGPTGAGNPAAGFPSLSSQQAQYITTQLQRFKTGERPGDMMRGSVANLTETEMNALAEYISGMQ